MRYAVESVAKLSFDQRSESDVHVCLNDVPVLAFRSTTAGGFVVLFDNVHFPGMSCGHNQAIQVYQSARCLNLEDGER